MPPVVVLVFEPHAQIQVSTWELTQHKLSFVCELLLYTKWAEVPTLTDGTFHVIEVKNEVNETHPVYKKSAEQLSNAMDWFRHAYGATIRATPILVHPRAMFDKKAAIPTGCRVVTKDKLATLRTALQALAVGISDGDTFRDGAGVGRLLASFGLTPSEFTTRYTSAAMQES